MNPAYLSRLWLKMHILTQKKRFLITPKDKCREEFKKLGNSDCYQMQLKSFFEKKNVYFLNKKFGVFYFLFIWKFLDTFPRGQGVCTAENFLNTKTQPIPTKLIFKKWSKWGFFALFFPNFRVFWGKMGFFFVFFTKNLVGSYRETFKKSIHFF